jgi:hypothetical protein
MTLFRWRSQRRGDELAWAHCQWEQGNVVPHYLTCAFNSRGLTGPDVDLACGAEEPDVDRWEAGTKYPTWEQILRTAKLCRVSPASLMRLSPDPAERAKLPEPPPATYSRCGVPIMTFTDEAIAAILTRLDRASTD